MFYVPVVDKNQKPLMPCHPARARELVRNGQAIRRFNRGIFYIRLTSRKGGETQAIAVGIDPGSKKEGYTVKSAAHTYLNIQADAVVWVRRRIKTRREMRRGRRYRKTPYRKNRMNRARGGLPPSTKARWQWKLRISNWLSKMFPIECFIVEDIKARSKKGQRKWNRSFSPLEVGKHWFYEELGKIAQVETRQGYETKELRDALGLKKTKAKLKPIFEAYSVDSWVLANDWTGGNDIVDNKNLLLITPLQFHRRQLHVLNPIKGNIRKSYGSTRSLGFKRGSLIKHPKWGLCYVGGTCKGRISLHSLETGRRFCQNAKPENLKFLTFNSWRTHFPHS